MIYSLKWSFSSNETFGRPINIAASQKRACVFTFNLKSIYLELSLGKISKRIFVFVSNLVGASKFILPKFDCLLGKISDFKQNKRTSDFLCQKKGRLNVECYLIYFRCRPRNSFHVKYNNPLIIHVNAFWFVFQAREKYQLRL